jgi:hypothetical protein
VGIKWLGIVGLLLAGCTLAPPKLSATVGTYVLKQGNQTKTGLALFSSLDPVRKQPKGTFTLTILDPNQTELKRTYPLGKTSDWFADPDRPAIAGQYTLEASVDGIAYKSTHILDLSSNLALPLPALGILSSSQIPVSWAEIKGSQIYYVTLNKLVPGKAPEQINGMYVRTLQHAFSGLQLKSGETYFVAVGALSLDPTTGYADLKGIPFNASYGQSRTFTFNQAGVPQLLGEAPAPTGTLEYR